MVCHRWSVKRDHGSGRVGLRRPAGLSGGPCGSIPCQNGVHCGGFSHNRHPESRGIRWPVIPGFKRQESVGNRQKRARIDTDFDASSPTPAIGFEQHVSGESVGAA